MSAADMPLVMAAVATMVGQIFTALDGAAFYQTPIYTVSWLDVFLALGLLLELVLFYKRLMAIRS
jgi:hypothetical protein